MKIAISTKWYKKLDSTNNEAIRQLNNIDNLSVIAAEDQFAGRGQRGNSWKVEPGDNLTFTLILKFLPPIEPLKAVEQSAISIMATLVMKDFLDMEGIDSKIKWPNDIYVRDKKICGMLIENTLDGNFLASSIIGIGLNMNQKQFPVDLMNPTSMTLQTKKNYDIKQSLKSICSIFEKRLAELNTIEGKKKMREEYLSHLYRLDHFYNYRDNLTEDEFRGKIIGISPDFKLIVEKEDQTTKEFSFKEISYII